MTLLYIHRAPSTLCQVIGLLYFGRPVGNVEARMPRVIEFERALVA
jgi:hypothetical protein